MGSSNIRPSSRSRRNERRDDDHDRQPNDHTTREIPQQRPCRHLQSKGQGAKRAGPMTGFGDGFTHESHKFVPVSALDDKDNRSGLSVTLETVEIFDS